MIQWQVCRYMKTIVDILIQNIIQIDMRKIISEI